MVTIVLARGTVQDPVCAVGAAKMAALKAKTAAGATAPEVNMFAEDTFVFAEDTFVQKAVEIFVYTKLARPETWIACI